MLILNLSIPLYTQNRVSGLLKWKPELGEKQDKHKGTARGPEMWVTAQSPALQRDSPWQNYPRNCHGYKTVYGTHHRAFVSPFTSLRRHIRQFSVPVSKFGSEIFT